MGVNAEPVVAMGILRIIVKSCLKKWIVPQMEILM